MSVSQGQCEDQHGLVCRVLGKSKERSCVEFECEMTPSLVFSTGEAVSSGNKVKYISSLSTYHTHRRHVLLW